MLGSILGAVGGLVGSIFGANKAEEAAEKQAQLQREFAQNGIRWKVEDAKQAGIHPLYALGANTHSYAPISVGSQDFATVGQNLGSAIGAMTTSKEKSDGFAKTVQGLTLEKMGLENEILRSQLHMNNQPGRGPGMPGGPTLIDGQGSTSGKVGVMTAGGTNGVTVTVNPANTPAQEVENQYSEIPANVAGTLNILDDIMRTQKTPYPHELPQYVEDRVSRFLKKEVEKLNKEKRDPIFNENFW